MRSSTWALKPDWIRIPRIQICQMPCSVHETRVKLAQHLAFTGGHAEDALALRASYVHCMRY